MDLTRWAELRWQALGTPRTHSAENPESPQYASAFLVGAPARRLGEGNMATRVDGLENHVVPERVMGMILPTGAGADTIATVIAKCPSGVALYAARSRCPRWPP